MTQMPIDLRRRLSAAADLLRDHPFRCWFYGDSIGFEGLLAAADVLDRDDLRGFVHGYLRSWAARSEPFAEGDNTMPGHAACLVYEETGDQALLEALLRLGSWLRERPRIGFAFSSFSQSCLVRPYGSVKLTAEDVRLVSQPGPGVYLDCLHFDPPFFAHLGRILQDSALIDEALTQTEAYIDLLFDRDLSLFQHFHLDRTNRSYVAGWGRGQGWALLGLLDLIQQVQVDSERLKAISGVVLRLANSLRESQRPDGHWSAVVNERASGDETSTAAFVAAGFWKGIELGILEQDHFGPAACKAWEATLRSLTDDGVLSGVSAAVQSSTSVEHYYHVPRGFVVPWGQGPLLLAAARNPDS